MGESGKGRAKLTKKKIKVIGLSVLVSGLVFVSYVRPVLADEHKLTPNIGEITFEEKDDLGIVDPEKPEKPAKPGPENGVKESLRLDYVSKWDFGKNKITNKDRNYSVNAQLFHDDTPARGNYVQITDERPGREGWTLQVRQEKQFESSESSKGSEKELKGAMFSFTNVWANSAYSLEPAPSVTKEAIEITQQGVTYDVATAEAGHGKGTWLIVFGASEDNQYGQKPTLFKKEANDKKSILDSEYENKEVFGNEAVTLSIPDKTVIKPMQYKTALTWVLSEIP